MYHITDAPVIQSVLVTPATHGVAAALTDHQPLQQVSRALPRQAVSLLVLAQLFLHGLEQRLLDDGRHRDTRPFFRRGATIADGPTRLFAPVALGPFGQAWLDATLAVAGVSLVRGIAKNAPNAAAIPEGSTAG